MSRVKRNLIKLKEWNIIQCSLTCLKQIGVKHLTLCTQESNLQYLTKKNLTNHSLEYIRKVKEATSTTEENLRSAIAKNVTSIKKIRYMLQLTFFSLKSCLILCCCISLLLFCSCFVSIFSFKKQFNFIMLHFILYRFIIE